MPDNDKPDEELIIQVLRSENYYHVLGVTVRATEEELRVAYKERALRLHPDKNKHKKAEEAFKRVGRAYATLRDREKRRAYDMGSSSPDTPARRSYAFRSSSQIPHSDEFFFRLFEEMFYGGNGGISPENTLRSFYFTQQFDSPFVRRRSSVGTEQTPHYGVGGAFLHQVLPFILFLTAFLLSKGILLEPTSFSSEPHRVPSFSLQNQTGYSHLMRTSTLGSGTHLIYYTDEKVPDPKTSADRHMLRTLEDQVLRETFDSLELSCAIQQWERFEVEERRISHLFKDSTSDSENATQSVNDKQWAHELLLDLERYQALAPSLSQLNQTVLEGSTRKQCRTAARYKTVVRSQCDACGRLDSLRRSLTY